MTKKHVLEADSSTELISVRQLYSCDSELAIFSEVDSEHEAIQ
jgi:hypothetical protein